MATATLVYQPLILPFPNVSMFSRLYQRHWPLRFALNKLNIHPFRTRDVRDYKEAQFKEVMESLTDSYRLDGYDIDTRRYSSLNSFQREVRKQTTNIHGGKVRFLHKPHEYPVYVHVYWRTGKVIDFPTLRASGIAEADYVKATQLQDEIPGVSFEVEELKSHKGTYDPLLRAIHGRESFYIAQWGEKLTATR